MQAVSPLSRPVLRLAVIGALAAALGLAACGRKGPLDPPPSAAAPAAQPQTAAPGTINPFGPSGGGQSVDHSAGIVDGQARAPKGPNKRIPLDVLLN